jgi:hypothetical protein
MRPISETQVRRAKLIVEVMETLLLEPSVRSSSMTPVPQEVDLLHMVFSIAVSLKRLADQEDKRLILSQADQ